MDCRGTPRPGVSRIAMLIASVSVVIVGASCRRSVSPLPPERIFSQSFDSIPLEELFKYGEEQEYNDHPLAGDEQALSQIRDTTTGEREYSLLPAKIRPALDLDKYTQDDFKRQWVPVARIDSKIIYEKLGVLRGSNTLWVRMENSSVWKAFMVPSKVELQVRFKDHEDDPRPPPPTARWVWEIDEGVWVRCSKGCCLISALKR
jgi:hypothetical protein